MEPRRPRRLACRLHPGGKRSKVPYEEPFWFVMIVRDGLAVRYESYLDSEHVLVAAGLEE
jgi:ketosteroid isomerase-like protein